MRTGIALFVLGLVALRAAPSAAGASGRLTVSAFVAPSAQVTVSAGALPGVRVEKVSGGTRHHARVEVSGARWRGQPARQPTVEVRGGSGQVKVARLAGIWVADVAVLQSEGPGERLPDVVVTVQADAR